MMSCGEPGKGDKPACSEGIGAGGFRSSENNNSHGWTFISDPVPAGRHTVTIEWATDNPSGGDVCTQIRTLVIQHK